MKNEDYYRKYVQHEMRSTSNNPVVRIKQYFLVAAKLNVLSHSFFFLKKRSQFLQEHSILTILAIAFHLGKDEHKYPFSWNRFLSIDKCIECRKALRICIGSSMFPHTYDDILYGKYRSHLVPMEVP